MESENSAKKLGGVLDASRHDDVSAAWNAITADVVGNRAIFVDWRLLGRGGKQREMYKNRRSFQDMRESTRTSP